MPTRAQRFFAGMAACSVAWVLLTLDVLPMPLVPHDVKHELLPTIPWWALVTVSSYLLWNMGWGIFHFNDVPQAYEELLLDIKSAKEYLGTRGVDVG